MIQVTERSTCGFVPKNDVLEIVPNLGPTQKKYCSLLKEGKAQQFVFVKRKTVTCLTSIHITQYVSTVSRHIPVP